jgi:hypothetical protein
MLNQYLKKGWQAYKRNWTSFIGVSILMFLVIMSAFLIMFFPILSKLASSITQIQSEEDLAMFIQSEIISTSMLMELIPYLVVGFLLIIIIGTAFNLGIIKMSQEALKGKTTWRTILKTPLSKIITAISAHIIVLIMALLAVAVLIAAFAVNIILGAIAYIAFIIFIIHFSLVEHAIMLDDFKAISSIKKSFNIIRGNFWLFFKIILANMIISILLSLLDGIFPIFSLLQMFVVTPVFLIIYTMYYLDNRKIKKTKRKYSKIKKKRKRKR